VRRYRGEASAAAAAGGGFAKPPHKNS
jgi:hypothetical protein